MYIYIYIYIYISQKQDGRNIYAIMKTMRSVSYYHNEQWLCSNSCTWANDVRLHIADTNEPIIAQQTKQLCSLLNQYNISNRMNYV